MVLESFLRLIESKHLDFIKKNHLDLNGLSIDFFAYLINRNF